MILLRLTQNNYPMIFSSKSVIKTEASRFYSSIHISIYIPGAKEGTGSYKSRNKVRFCMSLRKIERKLLDKGISFLMVRELIKPLENFVNSNVWLRNCESVAIFSKGENVKIFALDISIPQQEFIADHFSTEPLQQIHDTEYKKIKESLMRLDYEKVQSYATYQ